MIIIDKFYLYLYYYNNKQYYKMAHTFSHIYFGTEFVKICQSGSLGMDSVRKKFGWLSNATQLQPPRAGREAREAGRNEYIL